MYERKATPAGTWHEVDLDVNNDGFTDFFVINRDVSGITTLTDGRQVTAVHQRRDQRDRRAVPGGARDELGERRSCASAAAISG